MRRMVTLSIALLFAGSANAETVRVQEAQYAGTIAREGKVVHLSWSTEVALAPDEIARRLTNWSNAERFVSGAKLVKLEKREGDAAVLHVDRDMPFFLPDVWLKVRAERQQTGDSWTIRWRRLDGNMKVYDRVWRISPAAGGARIDYKFDFEMPFDVPNVFAKKRMKQQLVEDFDRVQALAGGSARAPAKP